ncbi:MAG: alpha/beta fold hydrolase [Rhodobacteraceae bacterium]|nr:MAG: alpha/beta fold hydrolase [Paracoccaceae bacterium]
MKLNILRNGSPTGLPKLLIVHGLFGSARNWGAIAKRLSDSREVLSVDLRNHGESPWSATHTYADLACDLADLIRAEGGDFDVLGHSMGGKAAMVLALSAPDLVKRLLVADIAPVGYTHSQTPLIDAMLSLDLRAIATRGQADSALASRVDDPSVRAFLLQSLDLRADPPRWRLNLHVLAQEMAQITGWPKPAGSYTGPTLFLSGARSDYMLPEHRPVIKALFPNARFSKIPKAGHWLHAEAPRAFEETLRVWFD